MKRCFTKTSVSPFRERMQKTSMRRSDRIDVSNLVTPKGALKQVNNSDGTRHYETEDGHELASVTTLLGKIETKRAILKKWRDRVGDAEANKIMALASQRGTTIHNAMESFILGENTWLDGKNAVDETAIKGIAKRVNEHLTDVWGIELPLYSVGLCCAGTADLIGLWDGIPSVIDFKTSKRVKTKKDIMDYFMQGSAYAIMFEELYGINIEQIVIVMHIDHGGTKVFKENLRVFERGVRVGFPRLATFR